MPGPDTHVRLALPRDVDAVAAIQARAWSEAYAELLPTAVLSRLEPAARAQWGDAVEKPPTDAHHLLVALDGSQVVGFAAVGPSEDEDADPKTVGMLAVLAVDPPYRRAGHGSRLLAAVAETLRMSRFETAVCWLPEPDTVQRSFLESAGWALDGARRELDMGESALAELRLHTALQ